MTGSISEPGPAPRRFRLTQSISNGTLVLRPPSAFTAEPVTFMAVMPISAPCVAVRLGFVNGFDFTQTISKASVFPSDSYSASLDALNGRNALVVPTREGGAAAGAPIYFDNVGDGMLNLAGIRRELTLAANAANPDNAAVASTITWSDWAPCTSLPRADGGKWPLLFVYLRLASNGFVSTANNYRMLNSTQSRGRRMVGGLYAVNRDADCADHPAESEWRPLGEPPFGPWFVLQYTTVVPSIQIVMTGDSLIASPSDGISNAVWRAATDLSSACLPIEVLNLGWGGASWAVYHALLRLNAASIEPGILVSQVISRNGMAGMAAMHQLLAMATQTAQACSVQFGTKLIWNIPGCQPSWDANPAFAHGFVDMRNRLLEASAVSGTPIIDAPSAVGDVAHGAPWNHIDSPMVSDDGIHLNATGDELLVPLAKAALKKVIGLS